MKAIVEYDEIIRKFESGEQKFNCHDVDNFDLFDAYYKSVWLAKNDRVDFANVLFEDRIPALVDAMLSHGVRNFTLSLRQSGVQSVVMAFMNAADGAYLVGMTDVLTGHNDIFTGEPEKVPAFAMHLIDPERF